MSPADRKDPGSRRFLPLPIMASVLFVVLAIGSGQMGTSRTEYGSFPTVAMLLRTTPSEGESRFGIAYDRVISVSQPGDDLEVRFASLPGRTFSISDSEQYDRLTAGKHVYAIFAFDRHFSQEWYLEWIYVP